MLQACLNGNRTKQEHPAVPCSPAELAADAEAAVRAGAQELHMHPRRPDGTESLHAPDIAAALLAIRARVPGVPLGISTHAGIPTGGCPPADLLRAWTVAPDYVSINLKEPAALTLWQAAAARGIGIEAGLSSVADAEQLLSLPTLPGCQRVLIEIEEQDPDTALGAVQALLAVLARSARPLPPLLLHGQDASQWPLFHAAQALGLAMRIGLEDGLRLPSGEVATDNTELLRAARAFAATAR